MSMSDSLLMALTREIISIEEDWDFMSTTFHVGFDPQMQVKANTGTYRVIPIPDLDVASFGFLMNPEDSDTRDIEDSMIRVENSMPPGEYHIDITKFPDGILLLEIGSGRGEPL